MSATGVIVYFVDDGPNPHGPALIISADLTGV